MKAPRTGDNKPLRKGDILFYLLAGNVQRVKVCTVDPVYGGYLVMYRDADKPAMPHMDYGHNFYTTEDAAMAALKDPPKKRIQVDTISEALVVVE